MARIIVNKHYPSFQEITDAVFDTKFGHGEIIISNEVGFEGLYIKNQAGKVVKVTGISSTDNPGGSTPDDVKDFLKEYLETYYWTGTYTKEYIDDYVKNIDGGLSEEEIKEIVSSETLELTTKVDNLIGDDDNKTVREITIEELTNVLVTENAKESLDTLKEIADWIQKHPDDAAAMAKDISDLKAISADTRLEVVEDFAHTHENKAVLDAVTAEKIAAWDATEKNAKKYTDDTIKKVGVYNFQPLTETQYKKLIEDGEVVIIDNNTGEKKNIKYNNDTYYMVFEDLVEPDIINEDEIILETNWTPFETIVVESGVKKINLNSNKIIAPEFIDESDNSTNSVGLWVKGGDVTIEGEGEIVAQDAMYSMAVWANGGIVTINSGRFINSGDGCDLIYASNGGKVYIYGGEFIATEYKGVESGTGNKHSALNIKNSDRAKSDIIVYGGRFYGFDPANNVSEPNPSDEWLASHPNGFVAPGYKSVQDGEWWNVIKDE